VIDSHCHLADPAFATDLEAVIRRARAAGVEQALIVLEAGDGLQASQARQIALAWPTAGFAIGVHPHQAHLFADRPGRAADLVREQMMTTPDTWAVGEIGLDYHYDVSPRDAQRAVFREQVRLARDLGRPVVIHTREADQDTLAILTEEGHGRLSGVFHCFAGSAQLARAGLDLGFYLSAAGIATFPKATDLRATLANVPPDRLLTETDSPFLAPVPHRGKRNEPAWVARVVDALAALHGVSADQMAARTAENFRAVFAPASR
jgi:TatD DNase family protein